MSTTLNWRDFCDASLELRISLQMSTILIKLSNTARDLLAIHDNSVSAITELTVAWRDLKHQFVYGTGEGDGTAFAELMHKLEPVAQVMSIICGLFSEIHDQIENYLDNFMAPDQLWEKLMGGVLHCVHSDDRKLLRTIQCKAGETVRQLTNTLDQFKVAKKECDLLTSVVVVARTLAQLAVNATGQKQ